MPYILAALSLAVQIYFIVHVFRSGRPYWWAFIILSAPVVGSLAYYLVEVMLDGSYLHGTRYYPSPDTLLYFLGRVVGRFKNSRLADRVRKNLQQAVAARIGITAGPIDLAQRVLVCSWLGVRNTHEAMRLASMQAPHGAWPADSLFQYGRTKVHFGSSDLTTTFALAALHAVGMLESVDRQSSLEQLQHGNLAQISGMELHFAVLGDHLHR